MADHGVNLFSDVAQLVFYGSDYDDQVRDVLGGNLDVGITASSWLYVNHANDIPLLHVHNPTRAAADGEAFPFLTSTQLAPQYGVSASPDVPLGVKEAVADALFRLDRGDAEAVRMSVSGFEVPASYWLVRNLLQQMGLLRVGGGGGLLPSCVRPYAGVLDTITCPPGYVRQSEEVMAKQCKKDGLACPRGGQCFCRPCAPDHTVAIFPARTVLVMCCVLLG
eukprot:CAMPEP_0113720022 /NCGR_PEP_ID=MMETSP0038_2-20120614/36201_1 /TAXON_ID=2898 /ORGANISM="Cryptomonas paramecium" /LENGTH=221 /DNA_ID=CAMNT_0000648583 /DNA_START=679 /DNA_END=1340 /DNA_ORIENTATION=- /assembly_acc=CAM_ASM_000170